MHVGVCARVHACLCAFVCLNVNPIRDREMHTKLQLHQIIVNISTTSNPLEETWSEHSLA